MRAIIQRVSQACVSVDDKAVSQIGKGLVVLLGVSHNDNKEDVEYIGNKIVNLRIFNDEDDKMNLSVKDIAGEIMIVSQFTLYGDARKGRRPSFIESATGDLAEEKYLELIDYVRDEGFDVKTGVFGAEMDLSLINNGPVTIQLDSSKLY